MGKMWTFTQVIYFPFLPVECFAVSILPCLIYSLYIVVLHLIAIIFQITLLP